MATIYESAIVASLVVGLIGIPAASQGIGTQADFTSNISNISADDSIPREVVQESTSEEFYRGVETPFQDFVTRIRSDSTEVVLEDSATRLELSEEPDETVWRLSTSQGQLKHSESPRKSEELYTFSEGSLRRVQKGGKIREEFNGTDREEVERKAREMRKLLEKKLERVDRRRKKMREEAEPEIELEVNAEKEYVDISSLDAAEVDMGGWKLSDSSDRTYEFKDFTLEPYSSVRLYTGSGEDTDEELYWGYSDGFSIWSQEGDTATLEDENGEVVAEKSY